MNLIASSIVFTVALAINIALVRQWPSPPLRASVNVTRVAWSSCKHHLANVSLPMILTDAPIDGWPARTLWSPEEVVRRLATVPVYDGRHCALSDAHCRFTTWHDYKPLEPYVADASRDAFNAMPVVPTARILSTHHWLYFTSSLARLPNPALWTREINITDFLVGNDGVQVNLWMGRKGITTAAHYDNTYNIFVQLHGRKRFKLIPPYGKFDLYPVLHPHYCHSRTSIDEDPLVLIADLEAGDVLWLPPFWLHEVETLSTSVSVNVWTYSHDYNLAQSAYEQPIPFEEDWSHLQMSFAARVYAALLIRAVFDEDESVHAFTREWIVDKRYAPLYSSGRLRVPPLHSESLTEMRSFHQSQSESSLTQMEAHVKRGIGRLSRIYSELSSRTIRELMIANFIEHLANVSVGSDRLWALLLLMSEPL